MGNCTRAYLYSAGKLTQLDYLFSLVVAFVCYVQISNRRPTVEETLQKLEQMVQEEQVKQAHEAGVSVEEWRQRAYQAYEQEREKRREWEEFKATQPTPRRIYQ